jgi:cell filamentation protein, protein adenylyltransferase
MTKTKKKRVPGRLISCKAGYRAFVPDPLPPKITWKPSLNRALSEADRLLGRLAGEGRALPNPHLLMRPFIRREAVLSSRIEGTQATLGELLAAEAGAVVDQSPDDLREIANYVAALEHGQHRLKKLPLSVRLIREIHAKLMRGVRGERATPGQVRKTQNWIGPAGCSPENARYVPPPAAELAGCLNAWEEFLHDRSLPPLVQIALAHYQFEAIHPFLDGNGRVGRLLITLFLIERGILPTPLLYLSAFFEATRRDYYDHLLGISEEGQWEEWLEYFVNGVARQSEDAISRASRIGKQLDVWRKSLAGSGSKVPFAIIDLLAENPYWTVKGIAERLEVAFTTAQRAIVKLEGAAVLKRTTEAKRNRVYCAKAVMDILDEPANLKPSR